MKHVCIDGKSFFTGVSCGERGSTIDVECAHIESLPFIYSALRHTHTFLLLTAAVKSTRLNRADPNQTAHDESC